MKYKLLFIIFLFCLGVAGAQTLEECKTILHKGMDLVSAGEYSKSLEYLTKAEVLAEQNNWYEENFIANNCMGIVYYSYSDYGEALNYYLKAYNVATAHLPEDKEIAVINNIGAIYFDEENYEKALEFHKRAYDIAKKLNNKEKLAIFTLNMGNLYNQLKETDKAYTYIQEAFLYIEPTNRKLLLQNKSNLARNFLLGNQLDKCFAQLDEIYQEVSALENKEIYREVVKIYSEAYFEAGKIEKAIAYGKRALKDNQKLLECIEVFNLLANYSYVGKEYRNALAYKDSVVYYSDSLSKVKNTRLFENNKIKFDLQNYKNELKHKQDRLSLERLLYAVSIVIILIIMYLVYRLLKNKLYKEKQHKIIAEREQEIMALELEKEKNEHLLLEKQLQNLETDALLEQERLKNELEHKNRKLSAKALYLSGRNQMIEDLIQSLNKLPSIKGNEALKKQVSALKSHLRTDSEWESFITHFEEVNQDFLANLKALHPELNTNDIRFVCYVFMNLTTKEICSIFNITPEACRKRKARVAKKMNIPEGVSLYDYLSKLAN